MVTSSVPGFTCAGGLGAFPKIIAWAGLEAAGTAAGSVLMVSVGGARRAFAGTAAWGVAAGIAAGGGVAGGAGGGATVGAGGGTIAGTIVGADGLVGAVFVLTVANSAGGSIEYKEVVFVACGVWGWSKSISTFTSAARAAACAGLSSAGTERQLAIQTTHKPK